MTLHAIYCTACRRCYPRDDGFFAVPCGHRTERVPMVHIDREIVGLYERLRLLFTDQAEYYAVCSPCYYAYSHLQWSGSTRSYGWQEQSLQYLKEHQQKKGWCEFCDPVFGNGGWLDRNA